MPASWDTCSAHLLGRVSGHGTGLDLAVWAGVVPVLFGSLVLQHLLPACHLRTPRSESPSVAAISQSIDANPPNTENSSPL